jgi:hypothetical protein
MILRIDRHCRKEICATGLDLNTRERCARLSPSASMSAHAAGNVMSIVIAAAIATAEFWS